MEAEYSTFWLDLTPVLYEPGVAKVTKIQVKGISNSGHFAYLTKTKKPRMAGHFFCFIISAFDFSGKQGRALAIHKIAALQDQDPAPMRNGRKRYTHSVIELGRSGEKFSST